MLTLRKIRPGAGSVELEQRPKPEAAPDQVIVQVTGAGICGTDLHILLGEYPCRPPVTLGHEFAGVVVALGSAVEPTWLGTRVVVEPMFSTCGSCSPCLTGHRNLCSERVSLGSGVDGGFAEFVAVPARNLHLLPGSLSDAAAPVLEPLACVVNALADPAIVSPGDRVIVSGPGPIGVLAAQIARASGGSVTITAIEEDRGRARLAEALGFDVLIVSDDTPASLEAAVWIECSGAEAAARLGISSLVPRGRYVQLGLFGRDPQLPMDVATAREIAVTAGFASTSRSWRRAIAMVAKGAIDLEALVSEVVPLVQWELAFEKARNRVGLKYVLDPRLAGGHDGAHATSGTPLAPTSAT